MYIPLVVVEVPVSSMRPVVVEIVVRSTEMASFAVGPAEIDMFPDVEAAVIDVMIVRPVPLRVRSPAAVRFPVGVIEVPPIIDSVPAESRAPEPVYAPDGVIVMLPELVVVTG